MSDKIGVLDNNGASFEQIQAYESMDKALSILNLYNLKDTNLDDYIAFIVPSIIDQEFLYNNRTIITNFLNKKKLIVFNGHLFRTWIPNSSNFIPKKIVTFKDYSVKIIKDHSIFRGVLEKDLTFRKGVAGFFARGHHIPPQGSDIIITFNTGEPILYIDRMSTNGTILVHSGNDLLGYNNKESSNSTAGRIAHQLIKWIHEEFNDLNGGNK